MGCFVGKFWLIEGLTCCCVSSGILFLGVLNSAAALRPSSLAVPSWFQRCKLRNEIFSSSQALLLRAPARCASSIHSISWLRSERSSLHPFPPRTPGLFFLIPTARRFLLGLFLCASILIASFCFLGLMPLFFLVLLD